MKSYVLISNGAGGIATFQKYMIENILRIEKNVFLIDKKKNYTEKNFRGEKNIKAFYCNPIFEPNKVLNYLNLIKKKCPQKKIVFIFNNPLLLILYFFFIKTKFTNSKIYLFIHSHILKYSLSQILINFLSSIVSPFIERVYFVSKFTRNWWLKKFPFYRFSNNKIHHNSVQVPKFKKRVLEGCNIGFVGRLEKEKGIDVFIKIAQYMHSSSFKFHIFGEGSFKKKIPMRKNITLHNWEAQKKIYKKIDILLITSPIENCPFTVLEAKSYGIPTLCVSRGGVKEILKNNKDGIILKDNNNYEKIKVTLLYMKKHIKKFNNNCIKNRVKFNDKINFIKLLKQIN